jgi:hypothetical protein
MEVGKTHLCKCRRADIGDHHERCDGLLLDVALRLRGAVTCGIEKLEKALYYGVEVGQERIALNTLTEVD